MLNLPRYAPIPFAIALIAVGSFVLGRGTASSSVTQADTGTPKDESPLHGKSPAFTAIPLEVCPSRGGSFCPYEICGNSIPKTPDPGKLWNATVVGGKDGPVVICEWRR